MATSVDDLIHDLGADLQPVRRLNAPLLRAACWLAAVAAGAVVLASFADLPDLAHRLRFVPDVWLAVLGSTMTTILGAVATFELGLPDRRPAWALLPLPGLALWIAGSGMGCLRAWTIPGAEIATALEARTCFMFIVSLSVPLSVLMILMIRRGCPLRPDLTALIGGLAVAAGSATLLNFFHPYDAGATDLAVHVVAITLVVGLNRVLGGRLLAGSTVSRDF